MNKSIEYNCNSLIFFLHESIVLLIRKWYVSSDKHLWIGWPTIVTSLNAIYRYIGSYFTKRERIKPLCNKAGKTYLQSNRTRVRFCMLKLFLIICKSIVSLFFVLIKTFSNYKSKCLITLSLQYGRNYMIQVGMIKSYLQIHFLQMQLFTILKNPSYQFFSTSP